jgi:hypothetical protein
VVCKIRYVLTNLIDVTRLHDYSVLRPLSKMNLAKSYASATDFQHWDEATVIKGDLQIGDLADRR